MKYAYKTELKPTIEQADKIKKSIDICRFLYNQYIADNKRLYRMYQRGLLDDKQAYFITAKDFDKYVNNKLKIKPKFAWINACGSKARKKAIVNAEMAFKRHFLGRARFPKFKCKEHEDIALYFPKNNAGDWLIQRHRIKIPTLGFVRLKEYGYLPVNIKVINGNISHQAGRFFVSITVEQPDVPTFKSLADKKLVLKLECKQKENHLTLRLKRAERVLQRKYKSNAAQTNNQEKQKLKLRKLK